MTEFDRKIQDEIAKGVGLKISNSLKNLYPDGRFIIGPHSDNMKNVID